MAKICPQCGVKYKNSATKCIMCNTEFQDNHVSKNKKKILIFVIVGVILAAAVVTSILLFTGPKAKVRHIMDSYKRNDAEAVIATFPSFFMETDQINIDLYLTEIELNVRDMSDYIFSYNIEKAEKPSSQEREEFMENFRHYGGDNFDEDKLEDIRIVWINYKGNVPGIWPSRAVRFIMIKYEGKWCWWPATVNR